MSWARLIALVVSIAATPTLATTMYQTQTRCPVGGKTFKHMGIGSYSTWGELPDGLPIGSGPFPFPMTECPDNGLVLWDEFKPTEVKQLTPLVLSGEYQSMRAVETPSYRAWWLARQLGGRKELPWLLLGATWEAKAEAGNPTRVER